MDYESILFGLQPLLNASRIEELPVQDLYLESYLTVLDQLAVSLRSDANRTIVGSNGLLKELVRVLINVLDVWFHKRSDDAAWLKLASELIRCIANSLINDENNRLIFLGDETLKHRNELMDYWVGRLLKMDDCGDDQLISTLQTRTVVLTRNLCLENDAFAKRFAPYIRGPLLSLLARTQHSYLHDSDLAVLGSELLSDFIEIYSNGLSARDLLVLAQFIERVSKTIDNQGKCNVENADDEEDDPSSEIAYNLAQCAEVITKKYDEKKDFYAETQLTSEIQNDLLNALDNFTPKEFPNKLIVMRRITTAIGYISANPSNPNKKERDMCYYILLNSTNGYTLAASLIILSNSIQRRSDVEEITERINLERIIKVGAHLTDPVQFQGYLDILKKLLTLDTAMVLPQQSLQMLSSFLKVCHDQSTYFTDISPLIDNLLKKLLTVIPGSSLQKLLAHNSLLIQVISDRDSVLSCLALDKLLVARNPTPDHITESLWKAAFKFQDTSGSNMQDGNSTVSVFYLFQLAKTCGICLKGASDSERHTLLTNHTDDLLSLLQAAGPLQEATDRASESVTNNVKFAAIMVYKLLNEQGTLTEKQTSLKELAASFLKSSD
ncbi:hypothetical protein HG536_0A07860 [Torulaspora globosa]|uniref:SWI5-dependent HO expression protein 4 n=1 Tax=Torulaspora globosa TaxID=48254 RepID=A0A7G3ZBT5_9SACH|nr:uncharacterized protein HG536_0A07860 [Torulaspora globosa]QLL30971.1 hypothetical protein HG536_0A07860 [Torulaspora globosa]